MPARPINVAGIALVVILVALTFKFSDHLIRLPNTLDSTSSPPSGPPSGPPPSTLLSFNPTPSSSPTPDLFRSLSHDSSPLKSLDALIEHVKPLISDSLATCKFSTLPDFERTHIPLEMPPEDIVRKYGLQRCRGIGYLYDITGIYTQHIFIGDQPSSWSSTKSNQIVLFPCSSNSTVLSKFHDVSFYSSLYGAGLVNPVISPHTIPLLPGVDRGEHSLAPIPNFPFFLLTYRTLVPGEYSLTIMPRFVGDRMNRKETQFVGESEKRSCPEPKEWCLQRTKGGNPGENCNLNGVVGSGLPVTVKGPKIQELSSSFLSLPLSQDGGRSPDGFWVRVGTSPEDCESSLPHPLFEGNPCRVFDTDYPGGPVYAYQPSDRRYKFYSSEETQQCLSARGLGRIRVHGDSIVRGLYVAMPKVLADMGVNGAELKAAMHANLNGGTDIITGVGMPDGFEVRYKTEWGDTVEQLREQFAKEGDDPDKPGLFKPASSAPNLFIYNGGAPAHQPLDGEGWAKLWSDASSDPDASPPKANIFLLPPSLQGQRNEGWSRNFFRGHSERLEVTAKTASFATVDMEQMSMGWPVQLTLGGDGFHYGSNTMNMVAMVVVNMLCNAPEEVFEPDRIHEWYELGGKLKLRKNVEDLMLSYDSTEYINKRNEKVTIATSVPSPVDDSTAFDEARMGCDKCETDPNIIPYNIVDLDTFPLFES